MWGSTVGYPRTSGFLLNNLCVIVSLIAESWLQFQQDFSLTFSISLAFP